MLLANLSAAPLHGAGERHALAATRHAYHAPSLAFDALEIPEPLCAVIVTFELCASGAPE